MAKNGGADRLPKIANEYNMICGSPLLVGNFSMTTGLTNQMQQKSLTAAANASDRITNFCQGKILEPKVVCEISIFLEHFGAQKSKANAN